MIDDGHLPAGYEGDPGPSTTKEVLEALQALGVARVAPGFGPTVMRHFALDDVALRRVSGSGCVVGIARTVANAPGSSRTLLPGLEGAGDTHVLVVSSDAETATWGELTTALAVAKGVRAVFVDGVVRDLASVRSYGLPVWARRVYVGERVQSMLIGQVNVPVKLVTLTVEPGDIIMADDDGILRVPPAQAKRLITGAQRAEQKESGIIAAARRGEIHPLWRDRTDD
jgi:4-hydroxy-4-methyl-2-oxoglutarate aldolase